MVWYRAYPLDQVLALAKVLITDESDGDITGEQRLTSRKVITIYYFSNVSRGDLYLFLLSRPVRETRQDMLCVELVECSD